MGYYEVSIVSDQWIDGYGEGISKHKYCVNKLTKKAIDCIWHFISNNKLMAAKQKILFCNCTQYIKGDPIPDWLVDRTISARTLFEKYCQQFRREDYKRTEIVFKTPRERSITVNIKYEAKGEIIWDATK